MAFVWKVLLYILNTDLIPGHLGASQAVECLLQRSRYSEITHCFLQQGQACGTRKVPFLFLAAVTSVVFLGHLKFCFLHSETILSALPTTFWSSPLPLMPGHYFVLFLLSKRRRQKQVWAPCLSCLTHHPRHGVTASGDLKAADGQSSGLHCVCFK